MSGSAARRGSLARSSTATRATRKSFRRLRCAPLAALPRVPHAPATPSSASILCLHPLLHPLATWRLTADHLLISSPCWRHTHPRAAQGPVQSALRERLQLSRSLKVQLLLAAEGPAAAYRQAWLPALAAGLGRAERRGPVHGSGSARDWPTGHRVHQGHGCAGFGLPKALAAVCLDAREVRGVVNRLTKERSISQGA